MELTEEEKGDDKGERVDESATREVTTVHGPRRNGHSTGHFE